MALFVDINPTKGRHGVIEAPELHSFSVVSLTDLGVAMFEQRGIE